ncbi:hypothetical protein CA236_11285 [Sphingomonas sp. ABOLG]|jgi:hypothetical protein|uniref:hypothetical protein n=1 Tax=Sphingomonas sp. ABOLG TaxID=1985880 RepID=UPI000F7EE01F|nr:hypothetical protein [Sphingomonas sp. ABOLG]RSV17305.1 hypothetical protein CA236_11285 [Sphingomonas sp. ABOLG]
MGHEKRISAAFEDNGIKRVLVIDDVYDAPTLSEVSGSMLDFFGGIDGQQACRDAGLDDDTIAAATAAVESGEAETDELQAAWAALYVKFIETRDARFDPAGRFEVEKGLTLNVLEPLVTLLSKCGTGIAIVRAGLGDGETQFASFKPQVVFLDYYLSPDAVGEGLTTAVKAKARKTSIALLNRLLTSKPEEDPAIVLMSSEQVKARAQRFRQSVEKLGGNVLAVRFQFLQKGWVSKDGDQLKIDNQAADALLDTSQGFIFGQVLHRALKEWKGGAEKALQAVLKEIGSLEPKDFAYLFRFRLASEGERMGDYLEWLFGENLRALVAEKIDWNSDSFKKIDDHELSKGIEGAFEGPSVPIARLFQRVRVDEHEKGARVRHRLGDMFIKIGEKRVMVVITPDCDLVPRGSGPKVKRVLTMDGELRSFDQDSASADQFIFYKDKAYSLKWNPKTLNTFAVSGTGSLGSMKGVEFLGTLRPLYAQEVQRLALTDLGRIGLAVAPTMGVDASVTVHLRMKTANGSKFEVLEVPGPATATVLPERGDLAKGHRVLLRRSYVHSLVEKVRAVDAASLLPDDAKKLADFLREKNEDQLLSGFLVKGAATKDKGPLATTIKIAGKPDTDKDAAWLQLTLKLSEEAMEELLSVDPAMVIEDDAEAVVAA